MLPILKRLGINTFASLKVRNYRVYFIGQAASQTGMWAGIIAQTWLIYQLTHSGSAIGFMSALTFLPLLLLGPLGGSIVDRFPRRRLLFFTQLTSAILAGLLGILATTHVIAPWMVFVVAACFGLMTVIDNPARQSFLTELVGADLVPNAVALGSTVFNLARVVGPSVAALLIASAGLQYVFYFQATAEGCLALALLLLDARALHPSRHATRLRGQTVEGFKYVTHSPTLRTTLLMAAIIGIFALEFQVVLPLLASRTFGGNASTYALLTAALSAGAVIGGLTAATRKPTSKRVAMGALIFGILLLCTAVAPALSLALVFIAAVGLGQILFTAPANSILQLSSSPDMRGRVMSLWSMAILGSTPIGAPLIGWLCDVASPRAGLALGGMAALIAAVIGFTSVSRPKDGP